MKNKIKKILSMTRISRARLRIRRGKSGQKPHHVGGASDLPMHMSTWISSGS